MSKRNITEKSKRLKQKYMFDFYKVEEIINEEPPSESEEEEEEEKEQENEFYNLVDELENTKKQNVKKFVKENKDEINALTSDLKNKLLDLIRDKLY